MLNVLHRVKMRRVQIQHFIFFNILNITTKAMFMLTMQSANKRKFTDKIKDGIAKQSQHNMPQYRENNT